MNIPMYTSLCHHEGRYNFYDPFTGRFIYPKSISLDKVEQLIKQWHGVVGERNLASRLDRAHVQGCSSLVVPTLKQLVKRNILGSVEGQPLSVERCVARYLGGED